MYPLKIPLLPSLTPSRERLGWDIRVYDAIGDRSRTRIKAQDDVLGLEIPDPDSKFALFLCASW